MPRSRNSGRPAPVPRPAPKPAPKQHHTAAAPTPAPPATKPAAKEHHSAAAHAHPQAPPATKPAATEQHSTAAAHPPAPVQHAAPPPAVRSAPAGGSMLDGLAGAVVEGAAFGAANAVAHRAVDSVLGPRQVQVQHVHTNAEPEGAPAVQSGPAPNGPDACSSQLKSFQECIAANGNDMSSNCQFYMDMLNECRRGAAYAPVLL